MKIVINGIHANLRFSAAHMIPKHEFCGGIHGHSYHVDVVVEGERSGEFGFVADFKTVKSIAKEICSKLDHKVLIPVESPDINFNSDDPYKEHSIKFKISDKGYVLPSEDCYLLPLKSTSAEELAEFFAKNIFESLKKTNEKLSSVQICINEGIGQGAYYTINK
ncbi:MAG: 6-carboxytetrahydropterin synthase [Methanobacteriaceae archaeon]|nr:6-carboxytetrahydropterin synthase [Methanobacteriaceae archaeon]